MADKRYKLSELARRVEGVVIGSGPDFIVRRIATIDQAGPQDLTFLTNLKYKSKLKSTRAGAVLVEKEWDDISVKQLVVSNPYLILAKLLNLVHPPEPFIPGVHPGAFVSESATLGDSVSIGFNAYLGRDVKIGDHSVVLQGVVIGDGTTLGDHCIVYPNVVIYPGIRIGSRVIIHSGAVIGSDGFGFARDNARYVKVPQIGSVVIADDVEIGACCTIDRGSLGDTVIHRGVKLDNQIQVAHNVSIGEDTAIAAQTGISGSTQIGDRVTIAGQVGFNGHIKVGDDCLITGKTGVMKHVPDKSIISGYPPLPHRAWRKQQAVLLKAVEMKAQLARLQNQVMELESRMAEKEEDE